MQALDLEDEEWEQFASGIAQLAAQRERKPKDFKVFQVGPGQSMLVSINMTIISGACLPAGLQSVPKRASIEKTNTTPVWKVVVLFLEETQSLLAWCSR